MIINIVFLVWAIGAFVSLIFTTYKISYHLTATREISAENRKRAAKQRWCNPQYQVSSYKWYTAWHYLGWYSAAVAISAASIFGIPFIVAFFVGRNKALNDEKDAETQKEALRTLAHYEQNPEARAALEAGDGSAYVDALLNLEKPLPVGIDVHPKARRQSRAGSK